ncbi:MAG: hypothetical protein Q7S65_05355, partial [Nanoarchaeota archaeon]|nr:hypothetical protein [Nanoarchaeota archaeon]
MAVDELVRLEGPLFETAPRLELRLIQHAHQITTARRMAFEHELARDLKQKWFWTADGAVYLLKDGEPMLYLTRGIDNPLLLNLSEAARQLRETHTYVLSPSDKARLVESVSARRTLEVRLADLNLVLHDVEWAYFRIGVRPESYNQLNPVQREVAERIYGQDINFPSNMH